MPKGIYKRTPETIEKLRIVMRQTRLKGTGFKGHHHTEENKKLLSFLHSGERDYGWGKHQSEESRRKKSETHKKLKKSPEHLAKIIAKNKARIGKKHPPRTLEYRLKISKSNKERIANGTHNFWKGGITNKNKIIRCSLTYKLWREAIFKRDNFTCQICGKKGGKLQADHIKPFSLFPELRFILENGRTLCVDCHKLTDTYLYKAQQYETR
jgi:HNH endonuclease/NUMOD3 motif